MEDIDDQEAARKWENLTVNAYVDLLAENILLKKALEPFATFGEVEDDHGVPERNIADGLMRDRICDWFGPSDFEVARSAMRLFVKPVTQNANQAAETKPGNNSN
jgi:hypothetical protein